MSLAEMKSMAVEAVMKLNEEKAVGEILEHLERLSDAEKKVVNLAKHYNAIKEQYGDVLEKLAQ